ncbi:hypothetical protein [Streptomyces malaysiensis]|nr:hypothetical protein R8789_44045 [Streptomyces malaysiensis]
MAARAAAVEGLRWKGPLVHALPPLAVALLAGFLGSRLPAAAVV